ncbi:hypothetical protein HYV85_04780 [Candidatus Woesearchaeota archaeon]|nr:hypothetical protein [Candidatus Woesearchaeota archaeon]
MSILADVSSLFHEPEQSLIAGQGVHIVYIQESYRGAYQKAKSVGLELLLEAEHPHVSSAEEGGISISHYWPPLQHNQFRRESPELFHCEEGLGGISEQELGTRGICVIVDNSVDTGRTLWMAKEYLQRKGYCDRQIFVAASVWLNGEPQALRPFELRPLGSFSLLLSEAQRMLEADVTPFLPAKPGSLPEAISAYCRIL